MPKSKEIVAGEHELKTLASVKKVIFVKVSATPFHWKASAYGWPE